MANHPPTQGGTCITFNLLTFPEVLVIFEQLLSGWRRVACYGDGRYGQAGGQSLLAARQLDRGQVGAAQLPGREPVAAPPHHQRPAHQHRGEAEQRGADRRRHRPPHAAQETVPRHGWREITWPGGLMGTERSQPCARTPRQPQYAAPASHSVTLCAVVDWRRCYRGPGRGGAAEEGTALVPAPATHNVAEVT